MPSTPSDITLAVGDGARRMTYAEFADMRRISVASAERLVRRKHWVRTTGNDGVVRVLVPLVEARKQPLRTRSITFAKVNDILSACAALGSTGGKRLFNQATGKPGKGGRGSISRY